MGSLPSHDHSRCVPIPEEFIDYQNPWAIAAMAVASLGQSYVTTHSIILKCIIYSECFYSGGSSIHISSMLDKWSYHLSYILDNVYHITVSSRLRSIYHVGEFEYKSDFFLKRSDSRVKQNHFTSS